MDVSRRNFIKSLLRWSALGALGVGSAGLLSRSDWRKSCSSDGICSQCSIATSCKLPQALSYIQARKVLK